MSAVLIILLVIVLLVVGVGVFGVSSYNSLIKGRNLTEEAWRQIDVELKRRNDLIPNLVETVKGFAAHESGTLEAVMAARAKSISGPQSPEQLAQTEGELNQALGRLMSITEAYPDLKANQNFMALQNELSASEDRIASGRRYYNATVRDLNTKVESFPSSIFANMAGVRKAEYFEAEESAKVGPQVNFGQGGGTIAGPGQGGLGSGGQQSQSQGQVGGSQAPGQLPGYNPNEGLGQNYTPSPIQDQTPGEQNR